MKKSNLLSLVLLLMTGVSTANAQLEIRENGSAIVGERCNENYSTGLSGGVSVSRPIDLDADAQLIVLGPGSFNSGGRISFGDEGKVHIGELGNTNTNLLLMHAMGGLRYTAYAGDTFLSHSLKSGFQFYSDATGTAFNIRSDARLKKDINPIEEKVWERLYDTNPVSYTYITQGLAIAADSEKAGKVGDKTAAPDERLRYGFLAQEIKELFPELVTTDENGYECIDYIGFIPILVNAVKELKAELSSVGNSQKRMTASEEGMAEDTNAARLSQNAPNPFSVTSRIGCRIPTTVKEATIRIYDLQGKQLMRLEVEGRGDTGVSVEAAALMPGMYIYALICDGKEIDSKRMIVTE